MRVRVVLPLDKLREAYSIAKGRNGKEQLYGGMSYGGVRGSFQAHWLGMLAEMAVAYHYGVDVDRVIYEDHGDSGVDLVLPRFGPSQVKATTYWKEPWLRVESHKPRDGVETYFLCYVGKRKPETSIIGWATRKEVEAAPCKQCVYDGPVNFILPETNLHQA